MQFGKPLKNYIKLLFLLSSSNEYSLVVGLHIFFNMYEYNERITTTSVVSLLIGDINSRFQVLNPIL